MENTKSKKQILRMVQASMIIAIIILMQVTGIGYIMIPFASFTIMHIPVIIGAIIMGPAWGAFFGAGMGLCAMINSTFRATNPIDLAFSPFYSGNAIGSLIMSIGVRVLIGLFAGLIFNALTKRNVNDILSTTIAAFLATLTNTVGVLSCLWLLFPSLNVTFKAVIKTLFAFNFLVEAVLAILFSLAFAKVLPAFRKNKKA